MTVRICSKSWWICCNPNSQSWGTLSSGASVLEEATALNPDIILLDVDLGGISGFAVAEQLRRGGCPASVVCLSVHDRIDFIGAAKDLGAAATSANRKSPATWSRRFTPPRDRPSIGHCLRSNACLWRTALCLGIVSMRKAKHGRNVAMASPLGILQ
jgi:CheY-like chemotaxis protein